MRRVAVVGAGMTPFAEHFGLGIKDLVPMAVSEMEGRSIRAWIGPTSTGRGSAS